MSPTPVPVPPPDPVAALREEFTNEITARNLRWIWWLIVTATGLLLVYIGMNIALPAMRSERLLVAQLIDLGLTGVMLGWLAWLRRQPPALRWCRWFPVVYAVAVFALFDYYHLSSLPTAGASGAYVLGVVALGVLVLLPPRVFLPLLLANHAIYLFLVARSEARASVQLLAAMDGTAGVLVAGLASGLLYSSRWSDFQRERQLARSNAELARANAEMNELMAITAHDLRSPLEGVRRMLGVVRARTDWGRDQVERAVDTCLESCGGMVAFVGRLLDAHAAENERGRLTLAERDVRADCAAAVERSRGAAERKEQRITLRLPGTPAVARVDAAALAQVLDNLLGNAVKFSPAGAEVTCEVAATGGGWRIDVRDGGPGVPEEERAALFQKFHRGSARPTAGESSSGLGLFIVKTLAEAMGGRASYAARAGGGSVFAVELPRVGAGSESKQAT